MSDDKQIKPEAVFKSSAKLGDGEQIHILPCTIEHTGPAPVSTYFITETLETGGKAAAFRGRLLYGQTVNMPSEEYKIHVVKEQKPNSSDYWEYDKESALGKTKLQRAINYLKVAEELAKN